ncbi:ARM repeat superfamily protein [Hibiscus syriacus]|uniref:ARM repeat superfamily protein n=1 Tax=Hibiscus syriacus TaxID=106335 RepID=A0A6A2XLC1_HIBSY|nr:uncharacterized protein LOC120191019 [Hibiscus syriacus]KAE8659179.1 ARM repeat superfamily protein [Hibiscus syriacus]
MSWLARSLANSLTLDDDDDESASSRAGENHDVIRVSQSSAPPNEETKAKEEQQSLSPQQVDELHGIKEDLTQLKDSFTRQLFGVASFLAPPPPPPPPSTQFNGQSNDRSFSNLNQSDLSDRSISRDEDDPSDSAAVAGIGDDFAEIGGTLSKMASDYLPFGQEENQEEYEMENGSEEEEDQEFDVVGITNEVLAFARNIAHHPETWLDFSLDPDEDLDDFDMSDAQRDHAMAIEYLAPRLAALRIELCPCHMSYGYFWKVYFVLLHSRLNKADAEVLSTPQVMEARSLWMKELQKQKMPETDWCGGSTSQEDSHSRAHNDLIPSSNYFGFEAISPRTYSSEVASSFPTDYETEKHPVESVENPIVDKSVVEEKLVPNAEDKGTPVGPPSKIWIPDFDDEEIDWPEDEGPELGGHNGAALRPEDVENISFSDLEDFDEGSTRANS